MKEPSGYNTRVFLPLSGQTVPAYELNHTGMQHIYLLLRNNRQTGPHSLEELIQLGFQQHDLIWIEGKSYGWSSPTEIDILKPYLTPQKNNEEPMPAEQAVPVQYPVEQPSATPVPKKVFVKLPVSFQSAPSVPLPSSRETVRPASDPEQTLEQKAEALRQRAQAYQPQAAGASRNETIREAIKTNYNRTLEQAEEEYTSWIYQKKTKKKSPFTKGRLLTAGSAVLLLAAGWWISGSFRGSAYTPSVNSAIPSTTPTTGVVSETAQPVEEPSLAATTASLEQTTPKSGSIQYSLPKQTPVKEAIKKPVKIVSEKQGTTAPSVTKAELPPQTRQQEPEATSETVRQPEAKTVQAPAPEEKKRRKLKEVLGDIFKKKEPKEQTAQEDPQPAETTRNGRTATRRGEESSSAAPSVVNLADQVEVRDNKSEKDWMMGVQGLKVTLYNRSSLPLKSAQVEVLYYSDENSLLYKKVLSFENIPSKKSMTLSAPDHRLADHVDYKVLSATGLQDAYASY
ncbi:MAG TPA: hypothetical protein VHK91_00115 [Flavisolibacter sp.]|nr:hypothetical protein [Flavisolibacter sp.]